jgi:glutamate---cysteine ligase / carboxylate-amine ligase
VAALAALVHALALHEAERNPGEGAPPEAIAWSCFRAARDGTRATILHDGTPAPLERLARDTLALVRPRARELGCEGALEGVERLLSDEGGAGRQRAAHGRGGVAAMLELLVEETVGGRGPAG